MKMSNKVAFAASTALATPRAIQSFRPRADANDPARILADLTKSFEDFKAANEETIRAKADVVATEKVARINDTVGTLQTAIDDLNRRIAATKMGGANAAQTPERAEYAEKFNAWFRSGTGQDDLKASAIKAQLTRQSDPDGGYVVSPEVEQAIDRVVGTSSAMRQLATTRTTGAAVYKKKVGIGGAGAGWVGEGDTRTGTATPQIVMLQYEAMTMYAEPEATEEMLEDGDFDVAAWLADEVDITFSEMDGAAWISGDGNKKPRGLLQYDTVDDSTWSWGKLGFKVSGSGTDITSADPLIDLTEALKQSFRPNAAWVMNRQTSAKVRKFKDSTGQYLWQPSLEIGKPATLLGYGTYSDDNMPNVGAGAFPIAFGDFRRGYLILDRRGVRVLRNPYKNSGFVTFYTTKRVAGGVQHFQAMKLLKIST